MLQQTVLGPSVRKTDLFTGHSLSLCLVSQNHPINTNMWLFYHQENLQRRYVGVVELCPSIRRAMGFLSI
jgi:hypothetical protein